jgi:hypothetical protein
MGHVWNWRDARAFNTAGHPSLGPGSPPVLINGSHAHTAPSPALVAVYPSSTESPAEPYPIVYVPPSSTVSVPPGFYVIARPGDEFIVRVGGRGGMDAICNAANSNLVLVNLRVDGKELVCVERQPRVNIPCSLWLVSLDSLLYSLGLYRTFALSLPACFLLRLQSLSLRSALTIHNLFLLASRLIYSLVATSGPLHGLTSKCERFMCP